jgi:hypothetical protein
VDYPRIQLGSGKAEHDLIDAVFADHGQPVARPELQCAQACRRLVNGSGQLGVSPVARAVVQGVCVRCAFGPAAWNGGNAGRQGSE